jgi:hypothetical protein
MDFPFFGGNTATPVTWATRPGAPYVGQRIRCTDLGNKEFYWNGTQLAVATDTDPQRHLHGRIARLPHRVPAQPDAGPEAAGHQQRLPAPRRRHRPDRYWPGR